MREKEPYVICILTGSFISLAPGLPGSPGARGPQGPQTTWPRSEHLLEWGFPGRGMDEPEPKGLTTKSSFLLPGGDWVPWPSRLQGLSRIRCKSLSLTNTLRPEVLLLTLLRGHQRLVWQTGVATWPDFSNPLTRAFKDPQGPRAMWAPSD